MVFKDSGVVLRETKSGENDKMLTILLKDRGKTSVYARGARKPTSRFAAAASFFCYSEFVLNETKGLIILTSADIINPFMHIRSDYDAFCAASFIAEMADKMLLPGMNPEFVTDMCAACFAALNSGVNPCFVKAAYSLRFLNAEGYVPSLEKCGFCGGEPGYLTDFGAVCAVCAKKSGVSGGIALPPDARLAARYILESDYDRLFASIPTETVINAINAVCARILRQNVGVSFKSDALM